MLQKIRLTNFRNFSDQIFEFKEGINVIWGANGAGKTNILESIFLLATGKSFRADLTSEMIAYQSAISRVKGKLLEEESRALEVTITRGSITEGTVVKKTSPKIFKINDVNKRQSDFVGQLKVVLFTPEHLDLINGSPSQRREFLDTVLIQTDREYYRSLISYTKALRARNRLLIRIREEGMSREHLFFWDKLIIKNGNYISDKRREFIEFVNSTKAPAEIGYKMIYDANTISESRLAQYTREEVAAATTLVGPHRDDVLFLGNEKDLAKYASRGQQRMGVLWVKLAELSFIEERYGVKPVLLLDDIFSELDINHQKIVSDLADNQQTIITSTDANEMFDSKEIYGIELA
jgi:DNA replication and repair protein RecF